MRAAVPVSLEFLLVVVVVWTTRPQLKSLQIVRSLRSRQLSNLHSSGGDEKLVKVDCDPSCCRAWVNFLNFAIYRRRRL